MNHLNRQEQEVLEILKGCGSKGMNSYAWRAKYVQLPARIFGLKAAGYQITTRRLKNGSVDYILLGQPEIAPEPTPVRYEWVYLDNVAHRVAVEEPRPITQPASAPEQQRLFD